MMKRWIGLVVVLAVLTPARGQDVPAETNLAAQAAASRLDTSILSLEALNRAIQNKRERIAEIQEELRAAPDEVTRGELVATLRELMGEVDELNRQFEEFAVAVDISVFVEEPETEFNWQEEVGAILEPIIAEVKSATAESRIIGDLRNHLEKQDLRLKAAKEAVANVEQLLAAGPSTELEAKLRQSHDLWSRRRDDAQNQSTALTLQLENRLAERKSLLDSTTGYAKTFVRTRGRNLLLGAVGFFAVFFGVRLIEKLHRRLHGGGNDTSFGSRLGSLLFHIVSILGGLIATLLVFNMAGDWFLLGLVVIFLLGVGWAGINTLPQHVETVKLVLNIGSVREGERMVFDGTPWKVDGLSFTVRLVNPLLDGGEQRLPVKYLVGLHSRPSGEREEWFPCRSGDWVVLADGVWGRVDYQTPSAVQVVELGGSQRVYPTAEFLGQCPQNLSTGFRVTVTFGIDFRHQPISTTEIPPILQESVQSGLEQRFEKAWIRNVAVRFCEAGSSSLDYCAEIDVAGDAAPYYDVIPHEISRYLVDACIRQGWTIPFPQLTVHRAPDS